MNAVIPLRGPKIHCNLPVTRSTLFGVRGLTAARTTTAGPLSIVPGVLRIVPWCKSNTLPIQVTIEEGSSWLLGLMSKVCPRRNSHRPIVNLYASVLAMFWIVPGVLQPQSPVKIHVLGPSKLLLGVSDTGNTLLKVRYRELVAAIGAIFRDLKTGQFLNRDVISKRAIPSTWKKELVSTVYILDVALWWYLLDLTEALAPSVHC